MPGRRSRLWRRVQNKRRGDLGQRCGSGSFWAAAGLCRGDVAGGARSYRENGRRDWRDVGADRHCGSRQGAGERVSARATETQVLDTLVLVKPATVVKWHLTGFGIYWRRRSRGLGRPKTSDEIRDLIRRMSLANPLWGAPCIHGELLKLGQSSRGQKNRNHSKTGGYPAPGRLAGYPPLPSSGDYRTLVAVGRRGLMEWTRILAYIMRPQPGQLAEPWGVTERDACSVN